MIDPLKIVDDMIRSFEKVREAMDEAQTTLEFCDGEYQDLTHALELFDFNAVEGYKLAKQLQDNRLRRRVAKKTIELLQPLADLMNGNKRLLNELKNVHAQIEQTRGVQQKRVYRSKVRTDLQGSFDRSKR